MDRFNPPGFLKDFARRPDSAEDRAKAWSAIVSSWMDNAAEAYRTPSPGRWGTAGRNSVTGPAQFLLDAGVTRTFLWGDRWNVDWRVDATNVLNRVTYAAVNTVVGSPQFGLPSRANTMRKIQTSLRFRF